MPSPDDSRSRPLSGVGTVSAPKTKFLPPLLLTRTLMWRSPSISGTSVLLDQFAQQQTARERGQYFARLRVPAVLITPALLSVLPLLIFGFPHGPDLPSHLRFAQAFDQSLSQGNFYPAWQHLSNGGYGDGSFRIYSPLIYYALSAIKLFAADWLLSFKLLATTMAVAGSFLTFYWVRGFASSRHAILAAWIYCFAPFRINELYQSAMLSQFAGALFFLMLLGITERVAKTDAQRKTIFRLTALFALAFAGLIITHIPLAMMAVLTLPLCAVLRCQKQIRLNRCVALAVAGGLGLCVSAFYWMNLVFELPMVKGALIQPGRRFDYRGNFAFSTAGHEPNGWYVNLLFLATLALIVPAVLRVTASFRSRHQHAEVRTFAIVALFTLLMVTPLSYPLWKIIPKMSAMEFPWRWLAAASIFLSGLAGVSLTAIWQELRTAEGKQVARARRRSLVAIGAVVIGIVFSLAYPMRNALFTAHAAFETKRQTSRNSVGLEEWLPRWTTLEAANSLITQDAPLVQVPGRPTSIQSWGPEVRRFTVGEGAGAAGEMRTFFYPYWQLRTSAGQVLKTYPNANGVLVADIPAGPQIVEMKFLRPSHQVVGNILSISGAAILAALALLSFQRRLAGPSLSNF